MSGCQGLGEGGRSRWDIEDLRAVTLFFIAL